MDRIKVRLKERSYSVYIGSNIICRAAFYIKKALKQGTAVIITNPKISKLYIKGLRDSLKGSGFDVAVLTIPDTEKSKSFYYLSRLLNRLAYLAREKKVFIIALGGGVVGDVSGFLASIYKRGIPYIQIPTTLLAQIDSSIGGKTAIDLSIGKNLAGAFYQPRQVLIDAALLKTLPDRQIRAGIAEMIKYSLIKDAKFFKYLEAHHRDIIKLKLPFIISAISNCVRIKSEIVSRDEFEKKGLRTILNFGHTVGHSLETVSNYRYNHGEAIALGMVVALKISLALGLIRLETFERIFELINNCGLPVKIRKIKYGDVLKTISYDKKFAGKRNRFVLLKGIGRPIVKEDIALKLIASALRQAGN